MNPEPTAILKRLVTHQVSPGVLTVTLDGQEIGRIERGRPGWYWAEVLGQSWGGGKTVPNALKSIAAGYHALCTVLGQPA